MEARGLNIPLDGADGGSYTIACACKGTHVSARVHANGFCAGPGARGDDCVPYISTLA
jgi:hypothetical protein